MAPVTIPGLRAYIGVEPLLSHLTTPVAGATIVDAVNEAIIFVGHAVTSDSASHTLGAGGSIGWRNGSATFGASSALKVGVADVDLAAGPPPRAVNAADVITFGVSKTITGALAVTTNTYNTTVMDTGSKVIANGDHIAIAFQLTARGGSDLVQINYETMSQTSLTPAVTSYLASAYAAVSANPNAYITFADGAHAWIAGCNVFSLITPRIWNSTGGTKEYGQLFSLPIPVRVVGAYGWMSQGGDCEIVGYSDPLGTPAVACSGLLDANQITIGANSRKFNKTLMPPYILPANTPFVVAYKPGTTNCTVYYKTLGNAGQRDSDPWGLMGYGVSRSTGAFANANSSLDHYYIGLIVDTFDDGAGAGGGGPWVKHGGVWKQAETTFAKHAGTWKETVS